MRRISKHIYHTIFNIRSYFFYPNSSIKINSQGFTLVELLIATALVGGLSVMVFAIANPIAQYQRANDTRRKNDLQQIQRGLEAYYQDNGKYPLSTQDYRITGLNGDPVPWGSSWLPYISTLPKDPNTRKWYVYYSTNGQSYWIYASLDRGTIDQSTCAGGARCSSLPPNASCGGGICNYGVSSPNVSP